MNAIMYEGTRFCGVYPDYDESIELGFDFVLVDEVPDGLMIVPEGHYPVIVSADPLIVDYAPINDNGSDPTPEQIRIAELEAQLAQTNADMSAFMDYVMSVMEGGV